MPSLRLTDLEPTSFAYGDHSDVYRGQLNGQLRAVKKLRGVNANRTDIRDKLREDLRNQFETKWRYLDHPNVCRVYMIADDIGFLPALVLDYYPYGSLIKFIEDNQGYDRPTIIERTKWISDIAQGLAYLHSLEVYHGDIRGSNVFLDDKNNAVLADYGLVSLHNTSDFTSAKSTWTARWAAPELISVAPNAKPRPKPLDVYALGMTILEIISGKPPYEDKSDNGAIFAIAKNEAPKLPDSLTCNAPLKDLFDKCTCTNPDDRLSARDAADISKSFLPSQNLFSRFLRWFRSG